MSRLIYVEEKLIVGSAESGHEVLASMVGQYFAKAYEVTGLPSLTVAARAQELVEWNSLVPSTLSTGYDHEDAKQSWEHAEVTYKGFSDKVVYVKRDLKDSVAIMIAKAYANDVVDNSLIDVVIRNHQVMKERLDSLGTSYETVSFEEMVKAPHAVLTSMLHKLRPIEELKISMEIVEEVVTASEVRGLRSDAESPYIEKVGAWADVLTVEQAKYIDQKAVELGL